MARRNGILGFLDRFLVIFLERGTELGRLRRDSHFAGIHRTVMTGIRRHLGYRFAPEPFTSDFVFASFFLFNVLVKLSGTPGWNPGQLSRDLNTIAADRDAVKRFTMLSAKQHAVQVKVEAEEDSRYYAQLRSLHRPEVLLRRIETVRTAITRSAEQDSNRTPTITDVFEEAPELLLEPWEEFPPFDYMCV
ncbi:hypothetical protein GMRT_10157 [Giardia muris]|uniref:Uncharacterized protein n=1 Tax=Giardia muris TaxID=5742 RepID=A0A4Z1SM66_GIAMU|nr:hypothetical protein GMRT_10157 [Giardia muris]|eukprot:TNJ26774.1 hypothetical protein GMRT_10157 [Giardia muris]